MKKMIVFLVMCSCCAKVSAQNFGFSVVGGLNFTELEGDAMGDYYGVNTGVKSSMKMGDWTNLGVELLYSVNGEYILPEYNDQEEFGMIILRHVEIPVMIDFLIDINNRNSYKELLLSAGFAYTKLFSYHIENEDGKNLSSDFIYNKDDALLGQVGLSYFFTPSWAVNMRATLPLFSTGLDWTLMARLEYRFWNV